jgi:hypothetical protein
MKNLVLGSLLLAALASQTTGCIITSDDDDGGGDFATINAEWTFRTVNPQGQLSPPNSCPNGFATVALHNQEVDPVTGRDVGVPFVDLFDCAAMRDFTDVLPPGVYETSLSVTSDGGSQVYADSISQITDVTVDDKTFTTEIIDNGGYFKFGWDLRDRPTSAPITCRDLAASDGVGVTSTLTSNSAIFVADDFDCVDGEIFYVFTDALAKGTYNVAIQPINGSSAAIGPSVVLSNKSIGDRNAVTDLGVVTLDVD